MAPPVRLGDFAQGPTRARTLCFPVQKKTRFKPLVRKWYRLVSALSFPLCRLSYSAASLIFCDEIWFRFLGYGSARTPSTVELGLFRLFSGPKKNSDFAAFRPFDWAKFWAEDVAPFSKAGEKTFRATRWSSFLCATAQRHLWRFFAEVRITFLDFRLECFEFMI
jgi:hypothetical protein